MRYLASERAPAAAQPHAPGRPVSATLLSRALLTPTVARFRFAISDPATAGPWRPGQYVALAFADELDAGYSHMREDDPRSLNDDFVRTFTVSSPPPAPRHPQASGTGAEIAGAAAMEAGHFEVTLRNVGTVTGFLFRLSVRAGLEVPLRGFGGGFAVEPGAAVVPFVAGGIGITPLLAQAAGLALGSVRLFWAVHARDLGLVTDTLQRWPRLGEGCRVFVSGLAEGGDGAGRQRERLRTIEGAGARVVERRVGASDLERGLAETWYLCAGPALRRDVLAWLAGKAVVFEDFGY